MERVVAPWSKSFREAHLGVVEEAEAEAEVAAAAVLEVVAAEVVSGAILVATG